MINTDRLNRRLQEVDEGINIRLDDGEPHIAGSPGNLVVKQRAKGSILIYYEDTILLVLLHQDNGWLINFEISGIDSRSLLNFAKMLEIIDDEISMTNK